VYFTIITTAGAQLNAVYRDFRHLRSPSSELKQSTGL